MLTSKDGACTPYYLSVFSICVRLYLLVITTNFEIDVMVFLYSR